MVLSNMVHGRFQVKVFDGGHFKVKPVLDGMNGSREQIARLDQKEVVYAVTDLLEMNPSQPILVRGEDGEEVFVSSSRTSGLPNVTPVNGMTAVHDGFRVLMYNEIQIEDQAA